MRLDLLTDSWEFQNRALMQRLDPFFSVKTHQIRVYSSLMMAVFETAFGLGLFYSHKKNIALLKGQTYAFQGILPYLYKEGFQIQIIDLSVIQDLPSHIENLKKDTSFVLFAEDHPVTAECFDYEELDQTLNQKKMFSIRVSHHAWRRKIKDIQPYSVQICSLSSDGAFVIAGEKLKSPPMMSQYEDWRNHNLSEKVGEELAQFSEEKSLILDFEKSLPGEWYSFLKSQNRVFDRAVICHHSLNAEAVIEYLSKELKDLLSGHLLSHLVGQNGLIDCINFARLKIFNPFEEWWRPLPTPEQIRGLLIVHPQLLKEKKLIELLQKAESKCRI